MAQQQDATGLLGNQEGHPFCGLYAQALAAICFIHAGDLARAERIFDFYAQRVGSYFGAGRDPGGFPQFWNASTGRPHPGAPHWGR